MQKAEKPRFHGLYLPVELLLESELAKTTMILLCDMACFEVYNKSRETIAKLLKVTKPHVSVLLKELKDAGMIEEVGNAFNRKLYSATEKARRYFGGPNDKHNQENQEIIRKMEEENKKLLQEIHHVLGGERTILPTKKRLSQLKARRKNFSPEEILQAAKNLTQSPFHMGQNDQHTKYATADFLIKSDERVEEWLNDKRTDRWRQDLVERLIL